jgi:uncharacterized protein YndB with AHSA1/START domain
MNTQIQTQSEGLRVTPDLPHTIERSLTLRAPRGRVWRALVDLREFCKWFSMKSLDGSFEPGARLLMTPTEEIGCGPFYIFVEDVQPENLLSWRWHPGDVDPKAEYHAEPTTLVVFRLEEVADGTKVTVTESGFNQISLARRAKVLRENTDGWEHQMNSLQTYVGQTS